jgi:hypothetical protein
MIATTTHFSHAAITATMKSAEDLVQALESGGFSSIVAT